MQAVLKDHTELTRHLMQVSEDRGSQGSNTPQKYVPGPQEERQCPRDLEKPRGPKLETGQSAHLAGDP